MGCEAYIASLPMPAGPGIHCEMHPVADSMIQRQGYIPHNVLVKGRDAGPGKVMAAGDTPSGLGLLQHLPKWIAIHQIVRQQMLGDNPCQEPIE